MPTKVTFRADMLVCTESFIRPSGTPALMVTCLGGVRREFAYDTVAARDAEEDSITQAMADASFRVVMVNTED